MLTDAAAAKAAQEDPDDGAHQSEVSGRRPARSRARFARAFVAVTVLSLLSAFALAACGDDDDDAPADTGSSPTTVKATQIDGKITLDKASSATGNVEFEIHNTGKLTHEFVVLKTDLAEDKLPLNADGTAVDESGAGIEDIGERESIAPGSQAELSFKDLAPGKYVLICNVPGHYGLGMHTAFTVS